MDLDREIHLTRLLKWIASPWGVLAVSVIVGLFGWGSLTAGRFIITRIQPTQTLTPSPTWTMMPTLTLTPVVTSPSTNTPPPANTPTPTITPTSTNTPIPAAPVVNPLPCKQDSNYELTVSEPTLVPEPPTIGSSSEITQVHIVWTVTNESDCEWSDMRFTEKQELTYSAVIPRPCSIGPEQSTTITFTMPAEDVVDRPDPSWEWTIEVLGPDETWHPIQDTVLAHEVKGRWVLYYKSAPRLSQPTGGIIHKGYTAEVVFQWSHGVGLRPDEYYVLILKHKQGVGYIWTRKTSFDASWDSRDKEDGVAWLSDSKIGPQIDWQVVIAVPWTWDPNARNEPPRSIRSYYSTQSTFYWYDDEAQVP